MTLDRSLLSHSWKNSRRKCTTMFQGLCCRLHGPAAASRFFASRKLCQIQFSSRFSQHQPYKPYKRSSLSRRASLQPNRVQLYDSMTANSSPRFQMEDPAFALSQNAVSSNSSPGTPHMCALSRIPTLLDEVKANVTTELL